MTYAHPEHGYRRERSQRSSLFGVSPVVTVALEGVRVQKYSLSAGSCRKSPWPSMLDHVQSVLVGNGEVRAALTHVPHGHWQSCAGSGFYLPGEADCLLSWGDDAEVVVVTLGEDIVTGFGASVDRDGIPVFAEASAVVGPALGFFSSLLAGTSEPDRVATYALSRLSEEMVGSMFLERESLGAGPIRRAPSLYRRALSLIAARRGDVTFTVPVLARELAVSVRHLQRAFRDQGSTPAAEIRRVRVELARQLLGDSRYQVLSVPEIARYAGFAV